jgi:hypothetical protein
VVTSVPDLQFTMIDGNSQSWRVNWNSLTGSVTGKLASEQEPTQISLRRFLTRLHLTHGYTGEVGPRIYWAILVDIMSGVLIFWGVSGLFMWWQIKATRVWGLATIVLAIALAVYLSRGMHAILTQPN